MALGPLELIGLLIFILFLILIFKPDVMVRFGRSLGELRREMRRGEAIDDETLALAERLGIKTGGKTKEEILREIREKLMVSG